MIPYWNIPGHCIAGVWMGQIGVDGVRLRFTRLALYFVLANTKSQSILHKSKQPPYPKEAS